MSIRDRAMPVAPRSLSSAQWEDVGKLYDEAAGVLRLGELEEWLRGLPAQSVVGQPQAAVGCLLATFLANRTGQIWAVMGERFYLLECGPDWSWWLPTWAVNLERVEMQLDGVLTASAGLALVRFIDTHLTPSAVEITAWLNARRAA